MHPQIWRRPRFSLTAMLLGISSAMTITVSSARAEQTILIGNPVVHAVPFENICPGGTYLAGIRVRWDSYGAFGRDGLHCVTMAVGGSWVGQPRAADITASIRQPDRDITLAHSDRLGQDEDFIIRTVQNRGATSGAPPLPAPKPDNLLCSTDSYLFSFTSFSQIYNDGGLMCLTLSCKNPKTVAITNLTTS